MSVQTADTRAARYPLESIRALAAVAVVVFHAYQNNAVGGVLPWSGWPHALMLSADLAVDLFFVISGFLLWLPVSRALLAGRPQRPGRELVARRAARLLPLYVLVMLVAWSIANPTLPGNWQDLLAHLTMTHVYSDTFIFWTVGPAWTLAVEFHAFVLVALLVPVISWATPRLGGRRARLALAAGIPGFLAVAGLTYLAVHILVLDTPGDAWSVWFGPLAKAHLFAIGMGLAVASATGTEVGRGGRRALGGAGLGLAVVGVASSMVLEGTASQWLHVWFGIASAAALAALVLSVAPQPRALTWRPLVWAGTISYSLYLVHELVLHTLRATGWLPPAGTTTGVVVTAAATLAVTLVVAAGAHRYIERPFAEALENMRRGVVLYDDVGSEPVQISASNGAGERRAVLTAP